MKMRDPQPERLTLDRLMTPIGEALIVTDAQGFVRALDFAEFEPRMRQLLVRHCGPQTSVIEARGPVRVRSAVENYFAGDLNALEELQVRTNGTAFQSAVWAALRRIPIGATWSYGQLAAAIGSSAAVRAVGLANSRNPVAIVVPCHRVIGASGALTGYAGGLERKKWLLSHEGAPLKDALQSPPPVLDYARLC
jgi:methylated-DNA-[protein]-cysteine S-methyltransferase